MLEQDCSEGSLPDAPSYAKVSTPKVKNIYPRVRLYEWIDHARANHSIVWVCSPAGSGKTTLVSSYLEQCSIKPLWFILDDSDSDVASFFHFLSMGAPNRLAKRFPLPKLTQDHLPTIKKYARDYFRNLYCRMENKGVVVFDNFQDVDENSILLDCMSIAFTELPLDMTLVVISRNTPPAQFARFLLNKQIALLDWNSFRLTEEEAHGVAIVRHGHPESIRSIIPALVDRAGGWMSGFILLLERSFQGNLSTIQAQGKTLETIFDYFATEIFCKLEGHTQQFLLQTSVTTYITEELATSLTGNMHSGSFLRHLNKRNYFTIRHADEHYEYHPLFREFLLKMAAEKLGGEALKTIRRRCADLLYQYGQTELFIGLLIEVEEWYSLIPKALEIAPALISQGRFQTLSGWLTPIPTSYHEEFPCILYWLGISRMPFDPAWATKMLEKAFDEFVKREDADLVYLSWTGIVNGYFMAQGMYTEIEKWIPVYKSIVCTRSASNPVVAASAHLAYVTALCVFPDNAVKFDKEFLRLKEFLSYRSEQWIAQATVLAAGLLGNGEVRNAIVVIREIEKHAEECLTSPMLKFMYLTSLSQCELHTWNPELCCSIAEEALKLAEDAEITNCEISVAILISANLMLGRSVTARSILNLYLKKLHNVEAGNSYFMFCAALVALHEGDVRRAVLELEDSIAIAKKSRMPLAIIQNHLAIAIVKGKVGTTGSAMEHLREARYLCENFSVMGAIHCCDLAEANLSLLNNDPARALELVKDWLDAVAEWKAPAFYAWQLRQDVSQLFNLALGAAHRVEFVVSLVNRLKLLPPEGAVSENWPYPIKIFTLGKFELCVDGVSVDTSIKSAAKPLSLLRSLIAMGARQVSQQRLIDVLWPDSEADAGASTFHSTLHRLRKILKIDAAIILKNGCLTLDSSYVWVDAWSLEGALTQLEKACHRTMTGAELDRLAETVIQSYAGPFDVLDSADIPSIEFRERVHRRVISCLLRVTEAFEHSIERAIFIFEKVLEWDPSYEPAYQNLMKVLASNGKTTEAIAIYLRCRAHLSRTLGVMPSAITVDLYRNICDSVKIND
ncbi:MAG: hypothetical protein HPY82_10325 [Gammaproteobacteria bacterium]|nr:hypothetical protein [Gammaproteobacteria bacterium]